MLKATISIDAKQGLNLDYFEKYRPISVLSMDLKIYPAVIAARLT